MSGIAVQPDGKVLICGNFTFYTGTQYNRILRLNSNGSVDPSFNIGSEAESGADGWVRTMLLRPNGQVLIGGWFSTYHIQNRFRPARLGSDGLLDGRFANMTDSSVACIETIAVQSDGKVIIGGSFSQIRGESRNNVARLNANGSLDSTFDPGTGAGDAVNAVAVLGDGKILIGGNFVAVDGTTRRHLARLNGDGSLDSTFNPGVDDGTNAQIFAIAVQEDGKIVIAGEFTTYNGEAANYLTRLHPNGAKDATFTPGSGADAVVYSLAFQTFGDERRLLAGSAFTHFDGQAIGRIVRLK